MIQKFHRIQGQMTRMRRSFNPDARLGSRRNLGILFGLVLSSTLAAQAPGTDIYVASLSRSNGTLKVGVQANVKARPGYDNQPFFSADGKSLYYTSGREGQTDIYRYDFAASQSVPVTNTPESEYSPTLMPDGRHLSVIRVERDSTQRLWAFPLDGGAPRVLLDSIKPVGYHTWLNPDTVFVFVLGSPATLRRAELAKGSAQVLASDIGRTLLQVPGKRKISYVQRDSAGGWITILDPVAGTGERLARLPEGTEFYAWTPRGDLLSTRGNALLRWSAERGQWETVAEFSVPGLRKVTRLAVSPAGDRIALVGEDASAP